MTGTVAELKNLVTKEQMAQSISTLWENWSIRRNEWIEDKKELRNYLFATDTRTTSNSKLPWKNSTTTPKLTQIRDNLHANYISSIFPNDEWLRWEAYTQDAADIKKRVAIQAYMSNKTREDNMREVVSRLLYDYIDYGNAFADVVFVNESKEDPETGEIIPGYIGPRLVRISPYDIVFNPTAARWADSPKIVRSVMTIGELKALAQDRPEMGYITENISKIEEIRKEAVNYKREDFDKALGYTVDGFGDLYTYYQSGLVEILEIEGDIHDVETGELLRDHVITVVDRTHVIRKQQNPSWIGKGYKTHVGWRLRPDNLYAMGPLDNLVGMQYRIDHLENLKADLMDLAAFPPLLIKGDIDEFEWGPLERVYADEASSVELLKVDSVGLNADLQIDLLERKMEEYAGAPKQAMGIRTPGEKTAFEVQSLENASGRIFQEKTTNFEVNLLEPALNGMLESARRNMQAADVVRVMDDDLGVEQFMTITKEDISASGKLRPVGARHFAQQAQLVQNLVQLSNTPIWAETAAHRSSKELAKMIEDVLGLNRFQLYKDNAAIFEQADTQRLMNQVQEDLEVEQQTPTEPPVEG